MGLKEMFVSAPEGVEKNPIKLGTVTEYMDSKPNHSIIDEAGSDHASMTKQKKAHKNLFAELL